MLDIKFGFGLPSFREESLGKWLTTDGRRTDNGRRQRRTDGCRVLAYLFGSGELKWISNVTNHASKTNYGHTNYLSTKRCNMLKIIMSRVRRNLLAKLRCGVV